MDRKGNTGWRRHALSSGFVTGFIYGLLSAFVIGLKRENKGEGEGKGKEEEEIRKENKKERQKSK